MCTPVQERGGRQVHEPKGSGFGHLVAAARDLQDAVTSIALTDERAHALAAQLEVITAALAPHCVGERERCAGRHSELPGRGHPLLLPLIVDQEDGESMRGRVTFRQCHLGGNGAAHGGTIPLLFDDVLGRMVNLTAQGRPARTAYLHVNYRAITPLDVVLHVEAKVERREGRKRWASARMHRDGVLLADAEALFVALLPGQP